MALLMQDPHTKTPGPAMKGTASLLGLSHALHRSGGLERPSLCFTRSAALSMDPIGHLPRFVSITTIAIRSHKRPRKRERERERERTRPFRSLHCVERIQDFEQVRTGKGEFAFLESLRAAI